jgi:hypothetical protein
MTIWHGLTLFLFAAITPINGSDFPVEKWEAKAFEFVADDFSSYRDERLAYFLQVIYDPNFQENPEQYLAEWVERRGLTREYRFVEDAALEFFRNMLN